MRMSRASSGPPQLELLEAQRRRVRSREAFSIQRCWRRHRLRRERARTRAAVLLQAGEEALAGGHLALVAPCWPAALGAKGLSL